MARYDRLAALGGGHEAARVYALLAARWLRRSPRKHSRIERIRRIGVLMPFAKDSPEKARVEAFLQELQTIGLDRWSQSTNRVSLGDQRFAESGNGIGGIVSGRHPRQHHSRCERNATGDQNSADRIYAGCRSGQCWLCCQSGEAWRQHHRVHCFRLRNRREMARTAQGDCSKPDACRGHSEIPRQLLVSASSLRSSRLRGYLGWR